MVEYINNNIADMTDKNEFCDNKVVRAFLTYMLVDNPGAFFQTVNVDAESFASKESAAEKKQDAEVRKEVSIDTYKNRAMALFTLLQKRKEFGCNSLNL